MRSGPRASAVRHAAGPPGPAGKVPPMTAPTHPTVPGPFGAGPSGAAPPGSASGSAPGASAVGTRFASRIALTPVLGSAGVPRIATGEQAMLARLFAAGKDPLTAAANELRSAQLACEDAAAAVEAEDRDLHEAFAYAREQLDLASRMTSETRVEDLPSFARLPWRPGALGAGAPGAGGGQGAALDLDAVLQEVPRLADPVATSREELYGLRGTLRSALAALSEDVRRLAATSRRGVGAAAVLPALALLTTSASRIERIADVVVSHRWTDDRPSTPQLPGVGGDVELYASGRAAPYRRASVAARVRFTPGRVEVTTAAGRVSIGQSEPIGGLLWVAPAARSALAEALAPDERWAGVPELDELGTVHVLDAAGRSLASFAVADWASQPTTVVDQALVDSTLGDVPLGAARGVLALEAVGVTRGATTIGVPLRRGVAHPPDADSSAGMLRPAPHRPPYRGREASVGRAALRRGWRGRWWNRDLGPGFTWSWPLRALAPWLVLAAPFVVWPGGGRGWFQVLVLLLTLAALVEPYVAWLAVWARDLAVRAPATARYRAGKGPFAPHLELRGPDLVLTSRSGHVTRVPGPSDGDLGVVRLVRLRSSGTWGFALADSRWRWRAVLPAHEWTPNGRYDALEEFARAAGLGLADQDVDPLPRLDQETVAPGRAAATRAFGPHVRGLLILGFFAAPAALVLLLVPAKPARPLWLSLAELLLTFGGAGVLALLARWRLRRGVVG